MKRLLLAAACALTVAATAATASATVFGVTEDAGKHSNDGGAAVLAQLRDIGMSVNAVSVQWDPAKPMEITERDLLDRLVETAAEQRIKLVFAVYATRPDAVTSSPAGDVQFAAFLQLLARTYPSVREFVVGNEPNYGVFWRPQFDAAGKPVAGAAYEALLARSYDALKAVDPRIHVSGFGLAPQGNGITSTAPVLFIRDVGDAYRRSGRTRPLMDSLSYHPYPASSLAPADGKQGWPHAGVADLDRIKQAVWDAFHGTEQPTFEDGLTMKITEIGWQTAIPASDAGAYHGRENVRTTDDAAQAEIYASVVRRLVCDPAVTDVLFFHLIDETDLSGFQSGLVRASGTRRPAYASVKAAIAETGGRCNGTLVRWRHTENVVGASVEFHPAEKGAPTFTASAAEGATLRAAIVPADDPAGTGRDALAATLSRHAVSTEERELRARVAVRGTADADALAPGRYVHAVLLRAAVAPERTSLFVSEPFVVRDTAKRTPAAPGVATTPARSRPRRVESATQVPPAATTSTAPPAETPVGTGAAPAAPPAASEPAFPATTAHSFEALPSAPAPAAATFRFSTVGGETDDRVYPAQVAFSPSVTAAPSRASTGRKPARATAAVTAEPPPAASPAPPSRDRGLLGSLPLMLVAGAGIAGAFSVRLLLR